MDLKREFPVKNGKRATHFFMDGGTLHVPQDKLVAFGKKYVQADGQKRKLCLVESCNSENFTYFLDLDYKSSEQLNLKNIEDIAIRISKILKIGRCVVLVTEPREIDSGVIKSGIHMVWPGKHVNIQQAMEYRKQLLEDMGEEWESVLDTAVYRGGLRLPWSWKYNKDGTYSKPYIPISMIDETHRPISIKTSPDEYLYRMCSIIVPSQKREGWFDSSRPETEINNNEITTKLETFIHYNIPNQKNVGVKSIWENGEHILVNVKSKYCENKRGCHSSNHIYFVINKEGHIYQKCHDELCKDFRGTHYRLPAPFVKKLFSE